MNAALWKKALLVIPSVSKEEWDNLDLVSRWLISTRAAVLIMTVISCALAGLFALRTGSFVIVPWPLLTIGLTLAHATNNLFNDLTDYVRGVDKDNYFRTMYGPQPVAHGLMTKGQSLVYAAITGAVAASMGIILIAMNGWDPMMWLLLGLGAFFVLFYTWPLKYLAMGELAVLIVWASAPYALGVTTVIFGKHIDKIAVDRRKRIFTLPVVIGERAARYAIIGMFALSYALTITLIGIKYFTPVMGIVLLAIPTLRKVVSSFLKPKPETRPEMFPEGQGGWPLYFAPMAFVHNRSFGIWFVAGLIVDVVLRNLLPSFWH